MADDSIAGLQDFYNAAPLTNLTPEQTGVPQIAPLPQPPSVGLPPNQQKANHLLNLITLAATVAGGRRVNGLGAGVLGQQQQQEAEQARNDALNQANYRAQLAAQEQQQRILDAETQRRNQLYQSNIQALRATIPTLKDKAAYDQQVDAFASGLQQQGLRVDGNMLRRAAPYVQKNAATEIYGALDRIFKDPNNKQLIESGQINQGSIKVSLDGGAAQTIPIPQAIQLARYPVVTDSNGQVMAFGDKPLTATERAGVAGAFESALAQLGAQGKDPKDPKVQDEARAMAQKAIKVDQQAPTDPLIEEERRLRIQGLRKDLQEKSGSAVPLGVSGEDALQGVDPNVANTVRAIVNYRIPLPGGFALRSPFWQQVLSLATAYDPTFDATQYQSRQKLRTDFTSGKGAANIRSLNTAVAHLATLKQKADALENSRVQVWNTIANAGLTGSGDPRVTAFNNAATAVESELANVFKGTGASDQEIKQWRANLNSSQSPAQLHAAINTAIELMRGRLNALKDQFSAGMGKPGDLQFLSPESERILSTLDSADPAASGLQKLQGR